MNSLLNQDDWDSAVATGCEMYSQRMHNIWLVIGLTVVVGVAVSISVGVVVAVVVAVSEGE